jgi:hypothetical protein
MFDRPISQFLDLSIFPNELMELKGEAYVLGDSDLPIVIAPDGMSSKLAALDLRSAKNKKLMRKSIITIKTGIEFLAVIVQNHDFGAVEMKHAMSVIVLGLESVCGNYTNRKFENESLDKMRNIKLCITRSRKYKTWYKIYNALNILRSEFPRLGNTTTKLMIIVHKLLVGEEIGSQNIENWSRIMMQKPYII